MPEDFVRPAPPPPFKPSSRFQGTCKGGPMHGQPLVMEQDFCTVFKHPGEFVGVYKFKQGYEGIWIWVEK